MPRDNECCRYRGCRVHVPDPAPPRLVAPWGVLTLGDWAQIYADWLDGYSKAELARDFRVSHGAIRWIVARRGEPSQRHRRHARA